MSEGEISTQSTTLTGLDENECTGLVHLYTRNEHGELSAVRQAVWMPRLTMSPV